MQNLIEPDLIARIETDIKILSDYCRTLTEDNQRLREDNRLLEEQCNAIEEHRMMAIEHAKAILEELSIKEDTHLNEFRE